MVLNRCATRDRIINQGIPSDPSCLLCNSLRETRSHLYFDCSFSWLVLENLASRCNLVSTRDWNGVLFSLQNYAILNHSEKLLLITWQATIYLIWTERNLRYHTNSCKSTDSIILEVNRLICDRIASFRRLNLAKASAMRVALVVKIILCLYFSSLIVTVTKKVDLILGTLIGASFWALFTKTPLLGPSWFLDLQMCVPLFCKATQSIGLLAL